MKEMTDGWIQTFSGKRFYPLEPRVEDVCIEDIGHHLSQLCRFTGATKKFYSVAQHSVLVAQHLPPELAVYGLLHDAAEAYLNDISRPVKARVWYMSTKESMVVFSDAERKVMCVVALALGLSPYFYLPAIKQEDDSALLTEKRDLLRDNVDWGDWTKGIELWPERIVPLSPEESEVLFLTTWAACEKRV